MKKRKISDQIFDQLVKISQRDLDKIQHALKALTEVGNIIFPDKQYWTWREELQNDPCLYKEKEMLFSALNYLRRELVQRENIVRLCIVVESKHKRRT